MARLYQSDTLKLLEAFILTNTKTQENAKRNLEGVSS